MEGADFLKLEELILLAIAGKSEIYGLEIATNIAKASEDKVQLNYGSLYPYLNRLEKKGYITSRWEEENDRKGARRKYYQITNKGTQSLDEAELIRQQLRQNNIAMTTISSQSQPKSNLETWILLLQHSEEKERMRAIYRLERESKLSSESYCEAIQTLAAFIRTNSPRDKKGSIEDDIEAALDVIDKRKIERDPLFGSIDLSRTNLEGANLGGANLESVNLAGANLRRVNFEGANLSLTNIREADLGEASLRGADLRGANLKGADLERVDLTGADLECADLTGANLKGADLERVDLTEADLTEADLTAADLTKARNLTIEQLHSANNWQQALNIPDDFDPIPF